MTKPFTFTLMDWLETNCPLASIETPKLEWLEPSGSSLSVVQLDEPKVEKSYINGSSQYRTGYDFIAQGNWQSRLILIEQLSKLSVLLGSLRGTVIGDDVVVQKVEATTPSLRAQTENGIIRYGFSVTIIYKD